MDLKTWLNSATPEERETLADKAETGVNYLWQIAGGHRKPTPEKVKAIVKASEEVTPDRILDKAKIRPDIWGDD